MNITHEQTSLLSSFRSVRVKDADPGLLHSVNGAVIGGQKTTIAELFKDAVNIDDDKNDIVASYLVLSPENVVLGFYSLRCGELYRQVDIRKMDLCSKAWESLYRLQNNPPTTEEEQNKLLSAIKGAIQAGFTSPDEWQRFYKKMMDYLRDKNDWSGNNIEQVSEVMPGVEIKYLGVNEDAKSLWTSLGLPRRMGETLFWQYVVGKIEEIVESVGCQYVYLFAADNKPDGNLVGYYNTILHFEKDSDLSANKPHFDYNCRFMCQDIESLRKNKAYFFDHFNSVVK